MMFTIVLCMPVLICSASFQNLIQEINLPTSSASTFWKFIWPKQIRIIGGRPAQKGELPYQVIIKTLEANESYVCGGTIISTNHILTAAHCVDQKESVVVQMGETSASYQPGASVFEVKPSDILIHEDYDKYVMKNDVAIITLNHSQRNVSDVWKPAALPKVSQSDPKTYDNYPAKISGWGKTHDNETHGQNELHVAEVHVMPHWQCKMYFSTIYYEVGDDQICTSYLGSSTCNGDSGGGLIVKEDGLDTIIGIISFGTGMCEVSSPSVYTYVPAFLPWIQRHTESNNIV